ncbi:MAG TPA: CaiB/BaiF CoA-transferase family protein [Rhizomicrobium sp.]|nr:CaiB/BaiF CoA-transferase family protein [Rhizomicrobium sp.]
MGPLQGIKVVELAGLAPVPFGAMLLADMGAEVVRIDRKSGSAAPVTLDPASNVFNRSRRSIAMDLKSPDAVETVLRLVEKADIFLEGYRPGVTERMGLGPDTCLARNPRLVYGRMTGWGQTGPMAQRAGHDINYIALSGALHLIGRKGERPVPPLNLVGDMGGGGLFLAFGVLCALIEARQSGKGQVVDTAMIDGAALQLAGILAVRAMGRWSDERGTNMVDTGAPFYEVYETSDGKYIAVGAIEPQFFAALSKGAQLDPEIFGPQMDETRWPKMKEELAAIFKTKTRSEWDAIFEGTDACVTPVLSLEEAADHPHNASRGLYAKTPVLQPMPGPRFSRTPGQISSPPSRLGEHTREALKDWGISDSEIDRLQSVGAIGADKGTN